MSQCEEKYEFPSGIKIQCDKDKGHVGNHTAKWEGKEGLYQTWW